LKHVTHTTAEIQKKPAKMSRTATLTESPATHARLYYLRLYDVSSFSSLSITSSLQTGCT